MLDVPSVVQRVSAAVLKLIVPCATEPSDRGLFHQATRAVAFWRKGDTRARDEG
jgi:hypothetical protein